MQKDVDQLRAAVQALTRNAVPVIKLLDFIPEDIDAMQKELEKWRSETQLNTAMLQTEERSQIFVELVISCTFLSASLYVSKRGAY